jgi:hypothetical protein
VSVQGSVVLNPLTGAVPLLSFVAGKNAVHAKRKKKKYTKIQEKK